MKTLPSAFFRLVVCLPIGKHSPNSALRFFHVVCMFTNRFVEVYFFVTENYFKIYWKFFSFSHKCLLI